MFGTALVDSVRHWRRGAETRRALNALSDAQLADIGIRRDDIDDIAAGRRRRYAR